MILFKKSGLLAEYLESQRLKKLNIGFCPTMGALHKGHISLIENSKKETSVTVASIFVNPTQFNDPKDFEKYPITVERDIDILEEAGCDILFLPSVAEIYPEGLITTEHYELGYTESILEGKYRPGHYQGVCKVVDRLLKKVMPDKIFLGQKDFQQCMIIKKLVELLGLKDQVEIKIVDTVREPDGLAMSSRNMRLNDEERKKAVTIFKILSFIKDNFQKENINRLRQDAEKILESAGFRTDYVEIADAENLDTISQYNPHQKAVALIAAYLNDVRLIDNMLLN